MNVPSLRCAIKSVSSATIETKTIAESANAGILAGNIKIMVQFNHSTESLNTNYMLSHIHSNFHHITLCYGFKLRNNDEELMLDCPLSKCRLVETPTTSKLESRAVCV
ncbi:hypothetical protein HELRODRAFT_166019 [Helobdella robusta]|uniref:Uncharacterized protein n=1 Tax=Helobdella robusta TaxID=6412 RepID=T1EXL8_HELRO|nr:hypothetical protein HELRODRAFT_166019 [Helobdella robusta]ESN90361.1 hypothetical protein HELRODRAFT_166019 [Helobdella robusta]